MNLYYNMSLHLFVQESNTKQEEPAPLATSEVTEEVTKTSEEGEVTTIADADTTTVEKM